MSAGLLDRQQGETAEQYISRLQGHIMHQEDQLTDAAQQLSHAQSAQPQVTVHVDPAAVAAAIQFPAPVFNIPAQVAVSGPANAPSFQPPRFEHDVKDFDGKSKHLESFLYAVQSRVRAQQVRFLDDAQKIDFFVQYLGHGAGFTWFMSMKKSKNACLNTYDEFILAFTKRFADKDLVNAMSRALDDHAQTGSIATYSARFRELVSYLDLTEYSLCKEYYKGLKVVVKDHLLQVGKPAVLDDLEAICLAFDARLHEHNASTKHGDSKGKNNQNSQSNNGKNGDKKNNNSSSSNNNWRSNGHSHAHNGANNAQNANSSYPTDTPMEIDALKVKNLSKMSPADRAKEKQRRRDEDLCYWCGDDSHKIHDCPTAPADVKNKARVRIVAATEQSSSSTSGKANPKA